MRLKQRIEDFRVRELLLEAPTEARAHYRVYRVTKKKLTSIEAARRLAQEVGVTPADVSMAGLKDRQGVTIQHMAVHHGPPVSIKEPELRIEAVGYRDEPLTPAASAGNAFEVVVRGLDSEQLTELRANMPLVRDGGVINYFDDQRFGNLRHGQGWIALDLMRGEPERALRALLTSSSIGDDPQRASFKRAMAASWGDWRACRDVAGRFGEHHSLFEHLKREPEDFAGAFKHIATRLRLIHMYAFQSHLWNRAVADLVRAHTSVEQRVVVKSIEGPLVFPETTTAFAEHATFRIPGPRLEDVKNEEQRALLEDALATERLVPADFNIEGIPGFGLKGEDRPLIVRPQHMRVRPAEPDALNRGLRMVRVRFELPRGAYATLLVRRLLGRRVEGGAFRADPGASFVARRPDRPGRPDRAGRPDRPVHSGRRDHSGPGERSDQRDRSPRGEHGAAGYRGGGSRSYGSGSRDTRGDRDRGRFSERGGRAGEPGSRAPIQTSARSGAWRPGHGLSGDEPKDRERAQGGGGRDDRRPRREFGSDRGRDAGFGGGRGGDRGGDRGGYRGGYRGERPSGERRSFGQRDDRSSGRRDDRGGRSYGGRPDQSRSGGGRPAYDRPDRGGPDRGRPAWRGPDRGGPQRGPGGGGHGSREQRPWEAAQGEDLSRSASEDAGWGAREDARDAERGSGGAGTGGWRAPQPRPDDRSRGGHGGGGSRPFGRRPEGGRPERGGSSRSDRGPRDNRDTRDNRDDRGGRGGRGNWGDRGSRGDSSGDRTGNRSGWRPPQRDGERPRHEGPRSERPRHERPRHERPAQGQERSGGWDRRGAAGGRGGERPQHDRKPGGWGADRARHEHRPRSQEGGRPGYDRKPREGGAARPRQDSKRENEQERTPEA